MNWPKYVLLVWFALSAILMVAGVGKPRTPLTPNVAVVSLLLLAGLAWLVVIA